MNNLRLALALSILCVLSYANGGHSKPAHSKTRTHNYSHIKAHNKLKHSKSFRHKKLNRHNKHPHYSPHIQNYSLIINAAKFYQAKQIQSLEQLYKQHPTNIYISYLRAKLNLAQNNDPSAAINFIDKNKPSYFRLNLSHQLLNYYFNQDNYKQYIILANSLPTRQLNSNEICSYNYAQASTSEQRHKYLAINLAHLSKNHPTSGCALWAGAKLEQGTLNKSTMELLLDNLIITQQYSSFNLLANKYKLTPLNFNQYTTTSMAKLPVNKFLYINRIRQLAYKNTDQAFAEIQDVKLDELTATVIYNYLAYNYARQHNFVKANKLYSLNTVKYLSDTQQEWFARTMLYFNNWDTLIKVINTMAYQTKEKPVWRYWLAIAYMKQHKYLIARKILRQIPNNYSYYSMLARSELNTPTIIRMANPNLTNLSTHSLTQQVTSILNIYNLGLNNNLRSLIRLGSEQWSYLTHQVSNTNLLRMSNLAQKNASYDLGIRAGLKMLTYYINLIYPTPFLGFYIKYSKLFNIDASYALAISRQESRFNHKIIAFDGGVGLMQIMPQTSKYIADKLGKSNCYSIQYSCNIMFGSWYLGNLYSKFNNIIYSTAAYNAGPTRVRQWQTKLGSLDNRIQIELIPFDITRHYVQNVLANKVIYMAILKHKRKIDFFKYIQSIKKAHYLPINDDDHTDSAKLAK